MSFLMVIAAYDFIFHRQPQILSTIRQDMQDGFDRNMAAFSAESAAWRTENAAWRLENREQRELFDKVNARLVDSMLNMRQAQAQTQSLNIGQPDREKLIREGRDKIIQEWSNAILRGDSSGPGRGSHVTADAAVGLRHETDGSDRSAERRDDSNGSATGGDSAASGATDGEITARPAVQLTSEGEDP
jgi:hypothetical protein